MEEERKNKQNMLDKLDEIDKEILRVLQENCDMSLKQIKNKVEANLRKRGVRKRVPRTTVHSKIKRLEELEIIESRKAILDHELLGKDVIAFVFLNYERIEDLERGKSAEVVIENLMTLPGVQEIYTVAGEQDMLLKFKTDSVRSLARTVLDNIREQEGVTASVTSIVLRKHLETTKVDI